MRHRTKFEENPEDYVADSDVGDLIKLVDVAEGQGLENGWIGEVVGVCDGYCYWAKFEDADPSKQPSKELGFPIYFDEARRYKAAVQ